MPAPISLAASTSSKRIVTAAHAAPRRQRPRPQLLPSCFPVELAEAIDAREDANERRRATDRAVDKPKWLDLSATTLAHGNAEDADDEAMFELDPEEPVLDASDPELSWSSSSSEVAHSPDVLRARPAVHRPARHSDPDVRGGSAPISPVGRRRASVSGLPGVEGNIVFALPFKSNPSCVAGDMSDWTHATSRSPSVDAVNASGIAIRPSEPLEVDRETPPTPRATHPLLESTPRARKWSPQETFMGMSVERRTTSFARIVASSTSEPTTPFSELSPQRPYAPHRSASAYPLQMPAIGGSTSRWSSGLAHAAARVLGFHAPTMRSPASPQEVASPVDDDEEAAAASSSSALQPGIGLSKLYVHSLTLQYPFGSAIARTCRQLVTHIRRVTSETDSTSSSSPSSPMSTAPPSLSPDSSFNAPRVRHRATSSIGPIGEGRAVIEVVYTDGKRVEVDPTELTVSEIADRIMEHSRYMAAVEQASIELA